ncbi:MAG TPA: hypothetical protein VF120_12410 [Ktedonobacterales bacterium]
MAKTAAAPATSAQPAVGSGIGTQLRGFADRFGLSRLVQPMMRGQGTTGTTGAAGTTKPRSGSFKFLLGMMIFIFSAEFLVYILAFVDNSVFKGALEKTQIGNVPLLGKISPFFILYILLTLGLWMALYRFNIIPKDPFGVKGQQAAAARGATRGTTSRSTTAAVGRNRAARQGAGASASTAAKETSSSRRTVSGPNDAVYQRVKAAQRSRKRRDAKR